jgi:3-oxoadipate enol-lactonase
MRDLKVSRGGVSLHVQIDGADDVRAPTIMFANSLGTTLHLWDGVLPHLPAGLRIVRYDMRGHGLSDVPPPPYTMGTLISDAEAVCDSLNVRECVFVGLSVGGMVAQGLAVKRLDIVRAMVLSNTAAKIGTPQLWQERIDVATTQGMAELAETTMARWFGREFRESPAMTPWQAMFEATPPQGYAGICAAISGTDFFTPTSGLRLPTLGIAGSEDKATPPDLVRETVDLVPGSDFALMRRLGHLPCVEDPQGYAVLLKDFLRKTGHLTPNDRT